MHAVPTASPLATPEQLLLHAQGAVAESSETTMATLFEQGTSAAALASLPTSIDEIATWGADPARVRAIAAERPLDVRIVAGSAEPPITVLPSTLVADLKGLLRFPAPDGGGDGLWPRLFHSVALQVAAAAGGEEDGEQEAPSEAAAAAAYTVWAHRSWIARRCPYFGRALASGAWVGGVWNKWKAKEGFCPISTHAYESA